MDEFAVRGRTAPGFWRRFLPVWAVGLAGIGGMLLQPPPAALGQLQEFQQWSPLALRLLLAVNPAILVTLLAVVGAATAHRVGLQSALAGTSSPRGSGQLGRAVASGVAAGTLLGVADLLWAPWLGAHWQEFLGRSSEAPGAQALLTGVLYGGLTEEVMLRWGAMSGIAWLLLRFVRAGRGAACAVGVVVAALLFGLGHLPALASQVSLTPGLALRTVLLNFLPGLLFGWIYFRSRLEAAMAAHAATHIGLALVRLLA